MLQPEDSADRRAEARRPCSASSCLLLNEWGEASPPAEVLDISPGSVGLLCAGPLSPDDIVYLELTGPEMRIALGLRARVVHVAERPDGRWLIGCEFLRSIPETVVSLLR
jgi:hypothetical protein